MRLIKKLLHPAYRYWKWRFPDRRAAIAVLSIMKNEEWNLIEWVDHYFWQGADHIFIIDNGSNDKSPQLIKSHDRFDDITLVSLPEPQKQCAHYWTVFKKFRIKKRFRWLAVADADEFWYARKDRNLKEAIARFDEKFDVVYSRWSNFGCSGHKGNPESLRLSLVYRWPELAPHTHKKYIVRTDIVRKKSFMIHKIVGGCSSRTTVDNDFFHLNHYVTRSKEYWTAAKMTRGSAASEKHARTLNMQNFENVNSQATFRDEELANLVCQSGDLQ